MKKIKLFIYIASAVFLVGGLKFIHDHRRSWSHYYSLKYYLFGPKAKEEERALSQMIYSEAYENFQPASPVLTNQLDIKWRFRMLSGDDCCGQPIVDDADLDGKPEVYIGFGSKKVYALDGRTGQTIWDFILPWGRSANMSLLTQDLNKDGKRELVFASHSGYPPRVYALKTDKELKDNFLFKALKLDRYFHKRIYWVKDIIGDFIEGGLTSYITKEGEVRILVASRDAPSGNRQGTLNLLDSHGIVWGPIGGFDVCNHRPTIRDVNNDGILNAVLGSHKFYEAQYGNKISTINLLTGTVLWEKEVYRDTGYQTYPIVDLDQDGDVEIIVRPASLANVGEVHSADFNENETLILDGKNGNLLEKFLGDYIASFMWEGETYLLHQQANGSKIRAINYKTKKVYYEWSYPLTHILDFNNDGKKDLMGLYMDQERLTVILGDILTGEVIEKKQLDLERSSILPKNFGAGLHVRTIADIDGDGYWEIVVMGGEHFFYAIDLPYKVGLGEFPYRTRQRFGSNIAKTFKLDLGLN